MDKEGGRPENREMGVRESLRDCEVSGGDSELWGAPDVHVGRK